jgi:hypothetical protein
MKTKARATRRPTRQTRQTRPTRRNPPARRSLDVIDVLRRARAVAALAERLNELGFEVQHAMEWSHDRFDALRAEQDQILEAAEIVVQDITTILGE